MQEMPALSDRTKNLGTENAFVVTQEVSDLQSKGKNIISFCIGQPDFDTPSYIKEGAIKAINEGKTGYTVSAGIPELRKAVAHYFSKTRRIDVDPRSVVVAGGAKPFIGYAVLSVTDYGQKQEVLYPNPGFPIYASQIAAQGAVPVPLHLLERNEYGFDISDLKKKLNKRSRLLILNSPHNPTGRVLTRKELEQIAQLVLSYDDLWVLSDEVYCRMIHDGEFFSIASVPGMQERTIILDSASKTYAMTGWRVGFASNEKLAPSFSTWVTNTDSCAAHPNQYAALTALTGPQEASAKMMKSYADRRNLVVKELNKIRGIKCLSPAGAFYVWPNVTEACELVGARDSEEFRKRLLYDAAVAVLSDVHFGTRVPGEGEHIRISYATSRENIIEGLRRIKEFVEEPR
jgi:aspartate aminotransferase